MVNVLIASTLKSVRWVYLSLVSGVSFFIVLLRRVSWDSIGVFPKDGRGAMTNVVINFSRNVGEMGMRLSQELM